MSSPSRCGSSELLDPTLLGSVMCRVQVNIGPTSCETLHLWVNHVLSPSGYESDDLPCPTPLESAMCWVQINMNPTSYQTQHPWDNHVLRSSGRGSGKLPDPPPLGLATTIPNWFGGLYRPMLGPQGSVDLFLRLLTWNIYVRDILFSISNGVWKLSQEHTIFSSH